MYYSSINRALNTELFVSIDITAYNVSHDGGHYPGNVQIPI